MKGQKISLKISGMHCASCAKLITNNLETVPGVREVNVDYGSGRALLYVDKANVIKTATQAVEEAGYRVAVLAG